MRAYPICVIWADKNNKGNLENCKIRILDMTDGAKVPLYDYPAKAIAKALSLEKLQIDGLSCKTDNPKHIKYNGKLITDGLPCCIDDSELKNYCYIVNIDYNNNTCIAYNVYGERYNLSIQAVLNNYRDSVININGKLVRQYIKYMNSKILSMQSRSNEQNTILYSWVKVDEYKLYLKKHNLGELVTGNDNKQSYGLKNYANKLSVVNIPVGIECIRYFIDRMAKNDNITEVRIPNTVSVIDVEAFNNIPNIRKITYQPKESNTDANRSIRFYAFGCMLLTTKFRPTIEQCLPADVNIIENVFTGIDDYVTRPKFYEFDVSLYKLTELKEIIASYRIGYTNGNDVILPNKILNINKSFCSMVGINTLYIPKSLKNVQYSFILDEKYDRRFETSTNNELEYSTINKLVIADESELECIRNSFCNINAEIIDLSNCKKLKSIYDSFNSCNNLKTVILPTSCNEYTISDSFKQCPLLEEVINTQNPSIKYIGSRTFIGSKISEIDIDGKTRLYEIYKALSDNSEKLIIRMHGKSLANIGYTNAKYIISETVEVLGTRCMEDAQMNDVDILGKPKVIGYGAFKSTQGDIIDMFDWPVENLSSNAFDNSTIKTIILPKTLKSIESQAFNECRARRILIPDQIVNIGESVFKDCINNRTGTIIYTTKNNPIIKHFGRIKYNIKEFDSIDDAYNAIVGELSESSESDQLKIKLVYATSDNEILKEIASNKYIGKSKMLHNIYSMTHSLTKENKEKIIPKLNTSKLHKIMLLDDLISYIKSYSHIFYNDKSIYNADNLVLLGSLNTLSQDTSNPNYGKITAPYSSMVNALTAFTEPCSFFTDGGKLVKLFEYIGNLKNKNSVSSDISIYSIYTGNEGSIFELVLRTFSGKLLSKNVSIVVVTLQNTVVYITSRYADENSKSNAYKFINKAFTPMKYSTYYINEAYTKCNTDMDKLLKPELVISVRNIRNSFYNGIELSPGISNDIREAILPLVAIIGRSKKICGSSSLMLLSLTNGKLYKTTARIVDGRKDKISANDIINFNIEKSYVISELDDKSIKTICDCLGNNASELLKMEIDPDNYKDTIRNKDGAYDDYTPSFEWDISRQLNELGIKDLTKLNSKVVKFLFNTFYFCKKPMKRDIVYNQKLYKNEEINLSDGTKVVSRYAVKKRVGRNKIIGVASYYINYIFDPNDTSTNIDCYVSREPMETVFNSLIGIYNKNSKQLRQVTDDWVDSDDLAIIYEHPTLSFGCELQLCVSRATGINYLVASMNRVYGDKQQRNLILFRFKNSETANLFFYELYKTSSGLKSNVIPVSIVDEFGRTALGLSSTSGNHILLNNTVAKIRKAIMDGASNYEIIGRGTELLESLFAKQNPMDTNE